MKKALSITRIVLLVIFIAALAIMLTTTMSIKEHQKQVENTIGNEVSYYSDELYLFNDYYKYRDADGVQYWVSRDTNNLDYVYNPAAEDKTTSISQDRATETAYAAAQKYDSDFFKNDTIIELKDSSYYEFYIFQLNDMGYKNGKFIVVNVAADMVKSVALHTNKNHKFPELGLCIGEDEAIEKSYEATTESQFALKAENNHLVKTGFYTEDDRWVWEVLIYKTSEDDINDQSAPADLDNYFHVLIDAVTGEIIIQEWVQNATDYCPLDGRIF